MKELLEEGTLELSAANGTSIPYKGWMISACPGMLWLEWVTDLSRYVPFLVASGDNEHPIIGFNMIEELALKMTAVATASLQVTW